MLEPQKNWQTEVTKAEQGRVGDMNITALAIISSVYRYARDSVSTIFSLPKSKQGVIYDRIQNRLIIDYGKMFKLFEKDIISSYNEAGLEQRYLISQTLGREPRIQKHRRVKRLPTNKDFAITNRILSEKSVLSRNKKLAKRVTKIIKVSQNKGRSIQKTTELLEVEFGFRHRNGKQLTTRAKELLRKGLFSTTNGHFYMAYRIARTESMRMASIQSNDIYDDVIKREPEARLQMIAKIDGRTREQSIQMNRQLSRADGKFKYPDGRYYKHGEAPAQYSINDRETTITVFPELDEDDKGDFKATSLRGYKQSLNN